MSEVREIAPEPRLGLWERVFTRDSVKLEGTGRTDARNFVIPREDWATRGLEAYLATRLGTAVQPVELEANRTDIPRMLRRLGNLAAANIPPPPPHAESGRRRAG